MAAAGNVQWPTSDLLQATMASLGITIASEIGDKTFFIAAVMAMRNPRLQVFSGSLSALALMTILSATLGWAAPTLIPKQYTHIAAVILFFYFGFVMVRESLRREEGEESELEQVESEFSHDLGRSTSEADLTNGKKVSPVARVMRLFFSRIFLKAFSLTFLAEWGDRSQIATIGLAAARNVYGVAVGGIIGHTICTGAAVLGGKTMASHINERIVAACGGVLFLIFGIISLIEGPG